jgi:uncharacterized lipoprotein YajG
MCSLLGRPEPLRGDAMGKVLLLLAVALALSGCATQAPPPHFVHNGPPLPQYQLDADVAACVGRTNQTALMSPAALANGNDVGSIAVDFFNGQNRRQALDQVMIGCMAEKGYVLG